MENGLTGSTSRTQSSFTMMPSEKRGQSRRSSDVMTRRLKNRERQRRYRARKRLLADMKKASMTSQSSTPLVELDLNGNNVTCLTRVLCKRNWKRDARRAHLFKNLGEMTSATSLSSLALNNESQTICLAPGVMAEPPLEKKAHFENSLSLSSGETQRIKLGRRDWKAEARNKKC